MIDGKEECEGNEELNTEILGRVGLAIQLRNVGSIYNMSGGTDLPKLNFTAAM